MFEFDYQKQNTFKFVQKDVRICLNLVKAILGLMLDYCSFEAKSRVFEFDHQEMNTFKFFRYSKNDVRVRSIKLTGNLEIGIFNLTNKYYQNLNSMRK